jgi:hypothetical protein
MEGLGGAEEMAAGAPAVVTMGGHILAGRASGFCALRSGEDGRPGRRRALVRAKNSRQTARCQASAIGLPEWKTK